MQGIPSVIGHLIIQHTSLMQLFGKNLHSLHFLKFGKFLSTYLWLGHRPDGSHPGVFVTKFCDLLRLTFHGDQAYIRVH